MENVWRVIRWLFAGTGLLLLVAVVGVGIYTHTDSFRETLRQNVVAQVNAAVPGELTLERIEGSVLGSLTLIDLRLYHEGSEILSVPELRASYPLLPLIWGRVEISSLRASQPQLRLQRDEMGGWNIGAALWPEAETETASTLVVAIQSLELHQASVAVALSEAPQDMYRLTSLQLAGNARMDPTGTRIELQEVSSLLVAEGFPEMRIAGAFAYENTSPEPDRFTFERVVLESGDSRIRATGTIQDLESFHIQAQIDFDQVGREQILQLVPDWPFDTGLTGTANVKGRPDALQSGFDVAVAGAKISGTVEANITGDVPEYRLAANILGFDVALLAGEEVAGTLSGVVDLAGAGFELPNIRGTANVRIDSTEIAGWPLGQLRVRGKLHEEVATVDGQLTGELAQGNYSGTIALLEPLRYDMSVTVKQFDVARVAPDYGLKGELNLQGTIKGSGLTLAEINSRINLDILPSTIGAVTVQKGNFTGIVAQERIHISHAAVESQDARLTLEGQLGLDPAEKGQLEYRLRAADVSPWLALVGLDGSGGIDVVGQAAGNLDDLRARGTMNLQALAYEGITVGKGNIVFDLRHTGELSYPKGNLKLNLANIDAPIPLQTVQGAIGLAPEQPYGLAVDLSARDAGGRSHAVVADVDYQTKQIQARLTRLVLNLPPDPWALAKPAVITQKNDVFTIHQLLLRSRNQSAFVNGQFSLTGSQALEFAFNGLSVEGLLAVMADPPPLTGRLDAQGQLAGTATEPAVGVTARLTESTIAGQRYAGVTAAFDYRDQLINLNLTARQDDARELRAVGAVPVALSWYPEWRAEAVGNMDVRVFSDGLSLAFLNAFVGDPIQKIGGEISLDLRVRGSLEQPEPRGEFQLRQGNFFARPLGVNIAQMNAVGSMDPQKITINQFSARSRDGTLQGSGSLALAEYSLETLALSLKAERWPAIHTERYQAEVSGGVNIDGAVAAPKITGRLRLESASLRPDLAVLERGATPVRRDPTIVIVREGSPEAVPAPKTQPVKVGENDFYENAALDLQVVLTPDVWVRHPNANVELLGTLRVLKKPTARLSLQGNLETARGWIGFQGRRFELERGTMKFVGGEDINPALEIVARRRVSDYDVNVIVSGTLEKPALALRSEPPLDQADILALVAFGRPMAALRQSEQISLQQSAIDLTTNYAAGIIGRAVSDALGVEHLGVDIGEINFSGGEIHLGRYIGERTFVTVSQEVTGERGREVAVEYRLSREWKVGVSADTEGRNAVDIIWHRRY